MTQCEGNDEPRTRKFMVTPQSCTVVFCAIPDQSSHSISTSAPCGLGCSTGSGSPIGSGLVVWAGALVVGMVLRQASGQGTATAFVVVATLVLGGLLVLPRVGARVRHR